jgi:hypothetical protein
MANLQIDISGLCVFAFDSPLKSGDSDPTEAALLLPKLTHARTLRHVVNKQNEVLDQHFPILQFRLADQNTAGSSRFADFLCFPDANAQMTTGCCLLHGDELEIAIDGAALAGALKLSRKEPVNKDPQALSPDEKASLWWMATLEDAFPDQKGKLKPELLETPPAANQAILAKARLAQGRLRTSALTNERCTFVPVGSKQFDQFVAIRFTFDVDFSEKVEIAMTRRDDDGMRKSVLALKAPSDGPLRLALKNVEIDSLIGISAAYSDKLPEADFEIYAELADGVSAIAEAPLPFPRRIGPALSGGIGGGSVCPPTAGSH